MSDKFTFNYCGKICDGQSNRSQDIAFVIFQYQPDVEGVTTQ